MKNVVNLHVALIALSAPSAGALALTAAPSRLLPRPVLSCAANQHRVTIPATHATRAAAPQMLFGMWGSPAEAPLPRLGASLRSIGWLSWWSQLILSTVSGVLLLFANSVTSRPTAFTLLGRGLALAGLALAFASTLWTVSYARLASSLIGDRAPTAAKAAEQTRGIVRVAVSLNVVGMVLCILAAEAIVGTLAAKALTQSTVSLGIVASAVQPLDLLIVQANTNTLAAHFISLCGAMRLRSAASTCATATAME